MLNEIFIFIIFYLGYVLIWGIVNLIAYALTLAVNKPAIMHAVTGVSFLAFALLGWMIGLSVFWYMITLLFSGQFLWFIFMLFFGVSLFMGVIGLLQMPFILVSGYFTEKVENMPTKEIIDGNTIVIEGDSDDTVNSQLATYFLIVYIINLLSVLINTEDYPMWQWGDYIAWPVIWVFTQAAFWGVIVGIYMKLRYGKFWYPTKKKMMITTLKVTTGALLLLTVLFIFFGVWAP